MEENKFVNLIDRLSTVATLDKWDAVYDTTIDYFYWKKSKLSKDVRLVKISHDTYFYITPKEQIQGVIVEYLKSNFTNHNPEYKGMIRLFNKKVVGKEYTVKKTKDNERYFDKFTETLKADIYRDAIEDKKTIDDLNFVLSVALSK